MSLKAIDAEHFYLDEQLIDLAFIGFYVKKRTTAANYHFMSRSMNRLHRIAQRLVAAESDETDAPLARQTLTDLGHYHQQES